MKESESKPIGDGIMSGVVNYLQKNEVDTGAKSDRIAG